LMKIDWKTLEILSEASKEKPNSLKIAKKTGIPQPTVYRRLQKLAEIGTIRALPNFFKIGLRPLLLLAEPNKVKVNLIFDRISTRLIRVEPQRQLFFLTVPISYYSDYIERIKEEIPNAWILSTYNPIKWCPDLNFLTVKNRVLRVLWGELYRRTAGMKPGQELFSIPLPSKVDEYDVLIISELERDSLQQLKEIASKAHLYLELVVYHYKKHVKPALLGNLLDFPLVPKGTPWRVLKVDAENRESLEKIVFFLTRIPWLRIGFPLLDEYSAIAILEVPYYEEESLFRLLMLLGEHGVVRGWRYLGYVDKPSYVEKELPRKYFRRNAWINVLDKLTVAGREE